MGEARGVIARRLVRFIKRYSFGTGLNGCNSWTMEPRWAKVFADEAAARKWLAGTAAEVVPVGELDAAASPLTAGSP